MEKSRHSKKNKKRPILIILLLIFLSLMIYSGIKIIIWLQENQKSKEIKEKVQQEIKIDEEKEIKDEEKYNINFEEIKKINNDIIGWIKVWGTDIEFPVVQTTDNEFYLTHSMDKSYNSAGWIFADCTNKLDGTDKNIIIYGHNRRDYSMFASLKNILNKEWYEDKNNYYIPFIQENSGAIYEVFSVYRIETEDYYLKNNFNNKNEYIDFLNNIKNRSAKDFGINLTENDQILTLSTCADDNNFRVVLHARKLQKEISNNKTNEIAAVKPIEGIDLKDIDGKEKNYRFKYNNNVFKAQYTKDNWKIFDSYKITNEEDMKLICKALINIHKIHGKDGKSFRTAEDMVYEWKLHNSAYEILPENSKWKANAKDVDFDSADQGRSLEQILKDRLNRLTN